MNDEIMTGRNPSADQALARDLGVTLSPEQDEVTPLVAIGPAGYTVDASGSPVDIIRSENNASLLAIGYVRGIEGVRGVLKKYGVEIPIPALLDVLDLTMNSRENSAKGPK